MRFRTRGSLLAALAAIVLYHLANPALLNFRYGEGDLVQICLFIGVGLTTAKLTHDAAPSSSARDDRRPDRAAQPAVVRSTSAGDGASVARASIVDQYAGARRGPPEVAERSSRTSRRRRSRRTVGRLIGERLPSDAVASRYGGDEFVVAMPRCASFRARQIADDLCRAVSSTAPVLAGVDFPAGTISISIGISSRSFDSPSAADDDLGDVLFRAADAALYRAKEQGRNQVCAN